MGRRDFDFRGRVKAGREVRKIEISKGRIVAWLRKSKFCGNWLYQSWGKRIEEEGRVR